VAAGRTYCQTERDMTTLLISLLAVVVVIVVVAGILVYIMKDDSGY
jgi:hypothetical protein